MALPDTGTLTVTETLGQVQIQPQAKLQLQNAYKSKQVTPERKEVADNVVTVYQAGTMTVQDEHMNYTKV